MSMATWVIAPDARSHGHRFAKNRSSTWKLTMPPHLSISSCERNRLISLHFLYKIILIFFIIFIDFHGGNEHIGFVGSVGKRGAQGNARHGGTGTAPRYEPESRSKISPRQRVGPKEKGTRSKRSVGYAPRRAVVRHLMRSLFGKRRTR